MKTLYCLLFNSLFLCICNCGDTFAQTTVKNNVDTSKTKTAALQKSAVMNELNKKPMTCKLTSPELQKRKVTVIAEIKKLIKEKQGLPNGYAYRFDGTDKNIDLLTDFIKTERQCCDFFNFTIDINNNKTTWLKITGAKGVKGFITSELEL